jgi:hypothetical protein
MLCEPFLETAMQALTIKDLPCSFELDRKAMAAVLGGMPDPAIGAPQASGHADLSDTVDGTAVGKITFNPFSITRKIDRSSPALFL